MQLEIKNCNRFLNRLKGMMFLKEKPTCGYYFPKCHSIHTFFCFFPLDIVLLDQQNNIIAIKKNIKPFHIYFFKCHSIIEVASGLLKNEENLTFSWSKK